MSRKESQGEETLKKEETDLPDVLTYGKNIKCFCGSLQLGVYDSSVSGFLYSPRDLGKSRSACNRRWFQRPDS